MTTLLTINIIPHKRKRLELIQTLDMLLDTMAKMSPEISLHDTSSHIRLQLSFENEDQMNEFFDSNEFSVLKGAVKMLGTQLELSVNGNKIKKID